MLDDHNPAVLKLMELAVSTAHKQRKHVGIYGQASSDLPEIVKWLAERKIAPASLSADSELLVLEAAQVPEREHR